MKSSFSTAIIIVLATLGVPALTSAAEPPSQSPAAPNTSPAVTSQSPAATAPANSTAKSGTPHAAMPPATSGTKQAKAPAKPEKKVDLNNASLAELQKLPTMTEAEAKKIIANRPYKSKGELVTRAGLPMGVYQAIRYKVELQKPRQPAAKK
jgi:DNA uptake protein ComE-like DNA-binding protein